MALDRPIRSLNTGTFVGSSTIFFVGMMSIARFSEGDFIYRALLSKNSKNVLKCGYEASAHPGAFPNGW